MYDSCMRNDREQALKLRLKGRSYTEISRQLGVAKSTLSGWFSSLILPKVVRARMLTRTNKPAIAALLKRNSNQTVLAQKRAAIARSESRSLVQRLSRRELLLIGLSLYWAEGYKRATVRNGRTVTSHSVSLANSDPKLISIFLRFLRECFDVMDEKIRITVRMFVHQNEAELRTFWAEVVAFPEERISLHRVTISRSSQGKRPFNQLPYGVANVRVSDSRLFHTIMGALEGMQSVGYTDSRSEIVS